jgi:ABC-type nitrate/sulfonate/bicarbonate transport system substrate-binding protein
MAAAAVVAALTCGCAPANAQAQLNVMVFQGVQNLPFFAAEAKGFFARRDLKVDVKIALNSEELRKGLAEGRYQIVHTAVDNAVAMAETDKTDIAVVMGGDNGFNHLFVQPDIRSYDDLRGKTVIVDAPNTAFAFVAYKILQQNGLKRGDYMVIPVGATFLRFEAMLKDKSYAASILNLPFTLRAERAGLKDMGRAVDAIGPYLSTSGFILRSWGETHAEVLARYIQAYVEALRWAFDPVNKTEAIGLLAERLKLPQDIAARSYEIAADPKHGFARDAQIDLDGFRNVLKLRAEMGGEWGGNPPGPEKYLDLSYYDRALAGLKEIERVRP